MYFLTCHFQQIIGLDSIRVQSNHTQIQNTLRAHFERINEIPMFKGSRKVFIPESNLANEASHMTNMLGHMSDVRVYWQKDDRPGVLKTAHITNDYQFVFNSRLKSKSIWFDSQFFTTTPGKSETEIKGQLREQLERYHYEYLEARTVHGNPKQTITGKMGSGMQDDLAIATLMAPYWGRIALNDLRRIF